MKKLEAERGITLMALIITIVVLLILSAVTIGTVKESKIIKHAQNAKEDFETIQEKELNSFQEYEDIILENAGEKVASYEDDVPIPVGFKYVDGKKDTGLVIEHRKEGSQFVWIPVKDGVLPSVQGDEPAVSIFDENPENLVNAGLAEGSKVNDFKIQLEKEYEIMKNSVKKYKGFYIGRYEVSSKDGKAQSVKGVSPTWSDSNRWYGLYKLCKTYQTSSVKSSMIWGCQYEAMMKFIGIEEASKSGRVSHDLSRIYLTGNSTGINGYCGSIKYKDIINNIYDLEGNVAEWTLELGDDNYSRVLRSGHIKSDVAPNGRMNNNPIHTYVCIGSRLALYIEL